MHRNTFTFFVCKTQLCPLGITSGNCLIIIIISTVAVVMLVQVLRTQECPVSNVNPKAENKKKLVYSRLPCSERGAGIA
jgi:hypothetical protein